VAWRKPLGEGFSGVAVAGGRLFTLFAGETEEFAVRLDPATGAEVWRTPVGPRFDEALGDGPRSTPTVDGERVFVLASTGRLAALHAGDGRKLWEVDAQAALGAPMPMRGFACSPLVDGDLLLVELGVREGKALVAFDKASGEVRWAARDTPAGYSSPIAVTLDGVRQYVFVNTSGREVVALRADGSVWWTHPWPPGAIAMPVFVPPNRILVSASADIGAALLAVTTVDGAPRVEEVWRNRLLKNHFGSSLYRDGYLYGFDNGTLKCLDAATGEQKWAVRGLGKGSLITADGLLLVLSDRGTLVLAEATPEAYRELGRAQVLTGKSWTAPTLAGGRLYLRDEKEIVCLEVAS
jgi:outer membrane protein assembly factor BamB